MDEESVGLFGVLLIVTVLVLSQAGSSHHGYAAPSLTAVKWEEIVSAFGCDPQTGDTCTLTTSQ